MSRLECIAMDVVEDVGSVEVVLLEPRPFRPFKSSEEYLIAMKEDLAEWLNRLYHPELMIDSNNFMDCLEDGVTLCKHANNVRKTAVAYKEKLEQRDGRRRRRFSTHVEIPDTDVLYRSGVKPKSFFARDNVHNFIQWCRLLGIYECLLFETDDLVLRKNEKSFILCLLEVARRGAHFGMPAPMLVQFEKEIDREIAKENHLENGDDNNNDEEEEDNVIHQAEYGPTAQIVTNDLRSLDEMVRDLVEICNCATQFPMIRVSEGKYRIGDTKILIFVRVLRNHVMVRVGGGWDTLSHYLEKHDPCRCRAGHRTPIASKLSISQNSRGATQMAVSYERSSSPPSRRSSGSSMTGLSASRKNSVANGFSTPMSMNGAIPDSSPSNRFYPHQRSPSPSRRLSACQLGESSIGPVGPLFQRSNSGLSGNKDNHCPDYGHNSPSCTQQPPALASPQNNLDSLESYDSGVGLSHRSPGRRRHSAKDVGLGRLGQADDPSFLGDSGSEVSDEGCPTACVSTATTARAVAAKTTRDGESSDSCASQASNQLLHSETNPNRAVISESKKSRIPLLGSLRGLKLQSPNASNSPALSTPTRPQNSIMSRSNSVNSDIVTSSGYGRSDQFTFHRDSFGRHSARSSRGAVPLSAIRSETNSAHNSTPPGGRYTLTWNGRNKRERPSLLSAHQLFLNPASNNNPGPTAAVPPTTATSSGSVKASLSARSRSVSGSGTSKNPTRASSTSPQSRRRYFGTSVTGPASPELCPSPNVNGRSPFTRSSIVSQQQQSVSSGSSASSSIRDMLKEMEYDNDESNIIKKMELILNQYKKRVENILAAEGKTLDTHEDWIGVPVAEKHHSTHTKEKHQHSPAVDESACNPQPLSRRNSFSSKIPLRIK